MKKLRVGVIGAGKIAERLHLPGYKDTPAAEVVAICDVIKSKADALAKQFNIPAVYTDYKKMIKEAGIDAVSVCLPNYLHAPVTIFAAQNKKHILVEKPMGLSVKEMKLMIKTAKANKVMLMVEQTHRFDPAHEVLKDVVDSGIIGKIVSIRGKLGHSGPEYWSDNSPWYFEEKKSGGGCTTDVGIHILDVIRFITGKEIESVTGFMANLVKKKFILEDNVEAALKFTDGSIGVYEASWTNSPYEVVVQLYGTKGKAIVNQSNYDPQRVRVWTIDPKNPYGSIKEVKYTVPEKSRLGGPVQHFVDCVLNKKKCIIDGTEGMKSAAVIIATRQSAKTGKPVKLTV
ncbi:MAG: Gfo/Idh/MocA family oxidoreductase [Spirochaetia bacterium]|nr:Gfo/Idh/MocA family oxidoreductase [Spirochaetia bacterium]